MFAVTNPLLEFSDSVWMLLLQDPGIPWPKVGGAQMCVCARALENIEGGDLRPHMF